MNIVNSFLIPVDDARRAAKFYHSFFGWDIYPSEQRENEEYHVIKPFYDGENESNPKMYGGMIKKGERNVSHTTIVIQVASIDECLSRLKAKKERIILEKVPIKPAGFFALIRDSEDNEIGLFEQSSET